MSLTGYTKVSRIDYGVNMYEACRHAYKSSPRNMSHIFLQPVSISRPVNFHAMSMNCFFEEAKGWYTKMI